MVGLGSLTSKIRRRVNRGRRTIYGLIANGSLFSRNQLIQAGLCKAEKK